jgi:hypothetical protein
MSEYQYQSDRVASSNIPLTVLPTPSQSISFSQVRSYNTIAESSNASVFFEGRPPLDEEEKKRIGGIVKRAKDFPVLLRDLEPLMPHCCEPFLTDFHFSWSFNHSHLDIQLKCILKLVEKEKKKVNIKQDEIIRLEEVERKLNKGVKETKYPVFEEDEIKVYFTFFFFFFFIVRS